MSEPTAAVEYQHITEHEVESAVKRVKAERLQGVTSYQMKCTRQVNMKWLED